MFNTMAEGKIFQCIGHVLYLNLLCKFRGTSEIMLTSCSCIDKSRKNHCTLLCLIKVNGGFWTMWGWVNNDGIWIFWWTNPLKVNSSQTVFSKRFPRLLTINMQSEIFWSALRFHRSRKLTSAFWLASMSESELGSLVTWHVWPSRPNQIHFQHIYYSILI